jgi:hypothetical protein
VVGELAHVILAPANILAILGLLKKYHLADQGLNLPAPSTKRICASETCPSFIRRGITGQPAACFRPP